MQQRSDTTGLASPPDLAGGKSTQGECCDRMGSDTETKSLDNLAQSQGFGAATTGWEAPSQRAASGTHTAESRSADLLAELVSGLRAQLGGLGNLASGHGSNCKTRAERVEAWVYGTPGCIDDRRFDLDLGQFAQDLWHSVSLEKLDDVAGDHAAAIKEHWIAIGAVVMLIGVADSAARLVKRINPKHKGAAMVVGTLDGAARILPPAFVALQAANWTAAAERAHGSEPGIEEAKYQFARALVAAGPWVVSNWSRLAAWVQSNLSRIQAVVGGGTHSVFASGLPALAGAGGIQPRLPIVLSTPTLVPAPDQQSALPISFMQQQFGPGGTSSNDLPAELKQLIHRYDTGRSVSPSELREQLVALVHDKVPPSVATSLLTDPQLTDSKLLALVKANALAGLSGKDKQSYTSQLVRAFLGDKIGIHRLRHSLEHADQILRLRSVVDLVPLSRPGLYLGHRPTSPQGHPVLVWSPGDREFDLAQSPGNLVQILHPEQDVWREAWAVELRSWIPGRPVHGLEQHGLSRGLTARELEELATMVAANRTRSMATGNGAAAASQPRRTEPAARPRDTEDPYRGFDVDNLLSR